MDDPSRFVSRDSDELKHAAMAIGSDHQQPFFSLVLELDVPNHISESARRHGSAARQSGHAASLLGKLEDDGCVSSSIPAALPYVMFAVALAFWGYCLLDFARSDGRYVRTFPKQVWLVVLVFGSVVGGLFWLAFGRPENRARR